jgi:uncharacterized membrane protein YbhN (UPF0104 family)
LTTIDVRRARRPVSARTRRAAAAVAGLAVLALVARTVAANGHELGRALHLMSHPAPGWLAVAMLCELTSYLAYAAAQRRLAGVAGQALDVRWLTSLAVAAQALCNFVPAGYVAANVLNFRELRRRGMSAGGSGWLLLATPVLYAGAFGCLALAGSEIAGGRGGTVGAAVRLGSLALGGLVALTALAAVLLARRGALPAAVRSRIPELRLPPASRTASAAAAALALFAASWLADCACLACGFLAVGAALPWHMLLLGYCAAQIVSFVPITPGGLGLVEGSLALTLAASGDAGGGVLAAVLLYRLLSYWGTLPAGGLGYAAVRRFARRRDGATARAPYTASEPSLESAVA